MRRAPAQNEGTGASSQWVGIMENPMGSGINQIDLSPTWFQCIILNRVFVTKPPGLRFLGLRDASHRAVHC